MPNSILRTPILVLALLASLCCSMGAMGQTPPATRSQSGDAAADPLYQELGGQPGLTLLVDDFMRRLVANDRTGPFFKNANQQHIKEKLVEQFCMVAGGPCTYTGVDMKTAHADQDITKGDFNALVEELQNAMDARGIAFSTQNALLARLAPMHRAVVTVH